MYAKPASLFQLELVDPVSNATPNAIPVRGFLSPPQIAKAYNLPSSTGYGIKIGIISLGGGFLQSDLDKSFYDLKRAGLISSSLSTPIINQVLLDGVSGTFDPADNGSGENTVDIFCVATMAPAADITIYIGNTWESPINQAIADGCHIITISWATIEDTFLESILATAAAKKIAVCVASGDWGSQIVQGYGSLTVCYPSSSPNVISVGGTKLTLNVDNTRLTETDDNRDPAFGPDWGGGGGVSTLFSAPSWQSGLHYTPIVNGVTGSTTALTMRGLPDISAPMNSYALYFNGLLYAFGGTSLSSPVMAGMLARLQQLTGIQRSSIDYNTIFYSNPNDFFDIIVGTNNTGITSGYIGTTGWDPVTGLGPPVGTSVYGSIHNGFTFPRTNRGFRSTGLTYPRYTSGVRL
jgi:kumamolisin